MNHVMKTLWKDEGGATIIEYVLLAGLIAVVAIAAITQFGQTASKKYEGVNNDISRVGAS